MVHIFRNLSEEKPNGNVWNMLEYVKSKASPEFPQCNVITNNVYIIIIITNNHHLYVGGEAR